MSPEFRRLLLAQLRNALDAGRLESVLGAMRGLEHLVGLAGLPLAAAMFARCCDAHVVVDTRAGAAVRSRPGGRTSPPG